MPTREEWDDAHDGEPVERTGNAPTAPVTPALTDDTPIFPAIVEAREALLALNGEIRCWECNRALGAAERGSVVTTPDGRLAFVCPPTVRPCMVVAAARTSRWLRGHLTRGAA